MPPSDYALPAPRRKTVVTGRHAKPRKVGGGDAILGFMKHALNVVSNAEARHNQNMHYQLTHKKGSDTPIGNFIGRIGKSVGGAAIDYVGDRKEFFTHPIRYQEKHQGGPQFKPGHYGDLSQIQPQPFWESLLNDQGAAALPGPAGASRAVRQLLNSKLPVMLKPHELSQLSSRDPMAMLGWLMHGTDTKAAPKILRSGRFKSVDPAHRGGGKWSEGAAAFLTRNPMDAAGYASSRQAMAKIPGPGRVVAVPARMINQKGNKLHDVYSYGLTQAYRKDAVFRGTHAATEIQKQRLARRLASSRYRQQLRAAREASTGGYGR